jgi:hypothetical protein
MKLFDFFGKALSDNGQPSSKRLFAFMILFFVFFMEAFKLFGDLAGFTYDTMLTFLVFSASALGLTTFEKFASNKQNKTV